MSDAAMSNKRKAAIIMVAIGAEYAAQIYRHLKDEDIEQLTFDVATMPQVGSETLEKILNEFYELCLAQKFISEGGIDYARDILEKAFGAQNAAILIEKVTHSIGARAFAFMKNTDPKQLYTFIQNEHPQTIALILSYAKKSQASAILSMLPRNKQVEVAERIALMDRTSPDVIKEVENALEKKLSSITGADLAEVGGVKYVAELLNSVDRGTEKFIIDEFYQKDPQLAEDVRKLMFVFEDIINLDETSIQRCLRDIDPKDLMVALKGSSEEVQAVIFANMSKRMGDTVREDMQYLRNVRHRDVEAAQQRIVAIIRSLEDAGAITISRGGDDIIV